MWVRALVLAGLSGALASCEPSVRSDEPGCPEAAYVIRTTDDADALEGVTELQSLAICLRGGSLNHTFAELVQVNDYLKIASNAGPVNVEFPALVRVEGRLTVGATSLPMRLDAPLLEYAGEVYTSGSGTARLSLPALRGAQHMALRHGDPIEILDFSSLEYVDTLEAEGGGELSLPALESANVVIAGGNIDVFTAPELTAASFLGLGGAITVIDLPKLSSLSGDLSVYATQKLEHVAFPALEQANRVSIGANYKQVSFEAPVLAAVDALYVVDNPFFPTCAATALAAQLGLEGDAVTISGNDDAAVCP